MAAWGPNCQRYSDSFLLSYLFPIILNPKQLHFLNKSKIISQKKEGLRTKLNNQCQFPMLPPEGALKEQKAKEQAQEVLETEGHTIF